MTAHLLESHAHRMLCAALPSLSVAKSSGSNAENLHLGIHWRYRRRVQLSSLPSTRSLVVNSRNNVLRVVAFPFRGQSLRDLLTPMWNKMLCGLYTVTWSARLLL